MQAKFSKFESKYEKIEDVEMGHGAQGSVFKVKRRDDPMGPAYAAKIYHTKEGGQEQTIFETEILMYAILPKTSLFGQLVEHFDEGDRKILILKLIDGHKYKHHKEELPVQSELDSQTAMKYAVQMTRMLLMMENYDVFFADFHGENLMLQSNGDLVLTDFGASARITDRTGNINPKGFCSQHILEKFQEKKQTASSFKENLFNEHNSKQLLSHFKLLEHCVKEKDEFTEAFKDLIKFIEKARQTNQCNEKNSKEADEFEEK